MKKTLVAMAFGAALLTNSNVVFADQSYNHSQKLCDALKPFLNERNLIKKDYLIAESMFRDSIFGGTYLAKKYYLDGTVFDEIRDLDVSKEGGVKDSYEEKQFSQHPLLFGFSDPEIVFFDPYQDGCNGNELIITDPSDIYYGKLRRLKINF